MAAAQTPTPLEQPLDYPKLLLTAKELPLGWSAPGPGWSSGGMALQSPEVLLSFKGNEDIRASLAAVGGSIKQIERGPFWIEKPVDERVVIQVWVYETSSPTAAKALFDAFYSKVERGLKVSAMKSCEIKEAGVGERSIKVPGTLPPGCNPTAVTFMRDGFVVNAKADTGTLEQQAASFGDVLTIANLTDQKLVRGPTPESATASQNTPASTPRQPGFEAILAVAGLCAAVIIYRRGKSWKG